MKFELLSPNLVLIIEELLKNQNLCKYLNYDISNPLSGTDISNTKSLMLKKFYPAPFNYTITTKDCSQLHVWYGDGEIKNNVIGDMQIVFDIIVAKKLWLINDGKSKIRPYEIMKEILRTLDDRSISTLGTIHFTNFRHVFINDKFDCLRLTAPMMTIEI